MADEAKRLLALKQKIQDATTARDRAEGRLQELMSRLKKEHKLTDLDAANDALDKLTEEADTLEAQLAKGIAELEKKYAW